MSQIQLYFDEDAGQNSLVQALLKNQIDVITTVQAKNVNNSDEQQLIWATNENRVIYTFNVADFCRLHKNYLAENKQHTGIIVVTKQRYSIGQQLRAILFLIKDKSAEYMVNKLIFLNDYVFD
jgi:hypothetical protein